MLRIVRISRLRRHSQLLNSQRGFHSLRPLHSQPKRNDKVIVAMSGGVDSSVTAALLLRQEFDVEGVYMRNWDSFDENGVCPSDAEWKDVQDTCKHLDIPCRLIDLSREYWLNVWESTVAGYARGLTPNPDVMCNQAIKFGAMIEKLRLKGNTHWFATGHYARIERGDGDTIRLLKAADLNKDQSYYLSTVSHAALSRSLLPLGNYEKPQVRELARQWKLPTAERPESMGVCFIGERRRFTEFISTYIPSTPGPVRILGTSRNVGEHQGLHSFTIGQRASIVFDGQKWFVAEKDANSNIIYVVPGGDNPKLFSTSLMVEDWHSMTKEAHVRLNQPTLHAVLRHRQPEAKCMVTKIHGRHLQLEFEAPQRAITPGQVVALYDGDWCLGAGTISASSSSFPTLGVDQYDHSMAKANGMTSSVCRHSITAS